MYFLELICLLKGKKIDICGLFASALTAILLSLGVFLAPCAILGGLDPFTQTMNVYCANFINKPLFKYIGYFICYVLTQWCTLEATRIYIMILVPIVTLCHLYILHLNLIRQRPLTNATLLLYEELNCVNQIGCNVIALIAGSLMGIGFIIFVFVNWIILKGLGIVPIELYVMIVLMAITSYSVISQSVPLAIKCYTSSSSMICMWSFKVLGCSTVAEKRYWRRRVTAQQPVALHYAQTKFEKDTQLNFYSNIVNHTINALILFE